LDLGKIKILHPQKHSTSYGYAEVCMHNQQLLTSRMLIKSFA